MRLAHGQVRKSGQGLGSFAAWKLEHIPRDSNEKANALEAVAASIPIREIMFLLVYY